MPCTQGVAQVQKPEDLLHMLRQLQQDVIAQNERLAQAAAMADSLRGAPHLPNSRH